jgi:hypothetical protein
VLNYDDGTGNIFKKGTSEDLLGDVKTAVRIKTITGTTNMLTISEYELLKMVCILGRNCKLDYVDGIVLGGSYQMTYAKAVSYTRIAPPPKKAPQKAYF